MAEVDPPNEWDAASEVAYNPARRAAIFVWVLGVLSVVAFGFGTLLFLLLTALPAESFLQAIPELTPEDLEEIRSSARIVALLFVVLGFAPGIAYIFFGFGVRKSQATPTKLAATLALTQLIIWGVILMANLVVAARASQPAAITLQVLTLGTFLALLGYTLHCLREAARAIREPNTNESWNRT